MLVPLWRYELTDVHGRIASLSPPFATCKVAHHAKYLGVFLGPSSHDHYWDGIGQRLLERAADVRLLTTGMAMKLKAFSSFCTSLVLFRAQFHEPSKAIRALYRQAAQRITATPWYSIPPNVLTALKNINLPFEIADLDRLSLAARGRLSTTCTVLPSCALDYHKALNSDDVLLVLPFPEWRRSSILARLAAAQRYFHGLDDGARLLASPPADLQSRLHAILRNTPWPARALHDAMLRRARNRWTMDSPTMMVEALCTFLHSGKTPNNHPLPLCVRLVVLRAFFDAWPTFARMQMRDRECRFKCHTGAADSLPHLLCCPRVRAAGSSLCNIDYGRMGDNTMVTLISALPHGDAGMQTAVYFDLVHAAFRSVTHSSNCDVAAAMYSRAKHLLRHHPVLRPLLLYG